MISGDLDSAAGRDPDGTLATPEAAALLEPYGALRAIDEARLHAHLVVGRIERSLANLRNLQPDWRESVADAISPSP